MNDTIITQNADEALDKYLKENHLRPAFLFTDKNVERSCLPIITSLARLPRMAMTPGETNKTIATTEKLWTRLHEQQATRHSLLINLGGGIVSDLGGFAAATFKRGIPFINIATTLLAAVDASIGGKTAINMNGVKNEIGIFAWPLVTIVALDTFSTLPPEEYLSGYGEMLKTAYLSGSPWLPKMLKEVPREEELREMISQCLVFKKEIVEKDPHETSLRKILNLGHTVAHALETLYLSRQRMIPHGIAVAYGLLVMLIISHLRLGLSTDWITLHTRLLKENFPPLSLTCEDYPLLIRAMHSDKKNRDSSHILFTLLRAPGAPEIDIEVSEEEVRTALDVMRDYLGI